ncbi:MAG: hypothetical protein WCG25_08230 [bacterium]
MIHGELFNHCSISIEHDEQCIHCISKVVLDIVKINNKNYLTITFAPCESHIAQRNSYSQALVGFILNVIVFHFTMF